MGAFENHIRKVYLSFTMTLPHKPTDISASVPLEAGSLRAAMRQARIEESDRSSAIGDLRAGEVARLEVLRDALRPVFAQVPPDADVFDHGLVTGDRPRLFVDMVSYVQMGRDRRQYCFIQDTRAGRVTIAEDERLQAIVTAVTGYVARRLVEREKALATLARPEIVASIPAAASSLNLNEPAMPHPAASNARSLPPLPVRRGFGLFSLVLAFLLGIAMGAGGLLGYALWQVREQQEAAAKSGPPNRPPAAPGSTR